MKLSKPGVIMVTLNRAKLGKLRKPSAPSPVSEDSYEGEDLGSTELPGEPVSPTVDLAKLSDDELMAEVKKRKLKLTEESTEVEELEEE